MNELKLHQYGKNLTGRALAKDVLNSPQPTDLALVDSLSFESVQLVAPSFLSELFYGLEQSSLNPFKVCYQKVTKH